MTRRALRHPLLDACGVAHGFGVRGGRPPARLLRPRQVHGAGVVSAGACAGEPPPEADAVVSRVAGVAVGIVTADCLPILLATAGGGAVAAVHAGWRGLAQGVVAAGVDALRRLAGTAAEPLVAVIGPHIGPCCYEVDAPVLAALRARFPRSLAGALGPARPGHGMLDLGRLARAELADAGVAPSAVGVLADACTCCDAARFHSYRRDGARAGRLHHFVAARGLPEAAGAAQA